MVDWDMNGDLTIAAYEGQNKALNRRNQEAVRLLRRSYVALQFGFRQDFQNIRTEIEAYFKEIGAPL